MDTVLDTPKGETCELNYIAFTYHKQCKKNYYPREDDYDVVIHQLKILGEIFYKTFEVDSKNKIHLHGVLIPRRHYPVCRYKVKGYNVRVDNIFDLEGWMKYLQKQQIYDKHTGEGIITKSLFS